MSKVTNKIHIGTSGWNYNSWSGKFYDEEVASKNMLPAYTDSFETVELNNSFYNLPSEKSIKNWLEKTPKDFVFSCKASRYITHMKKLKDPQQGLNRLFQSLENFNGKLGPILFQLPPNWKVNTERLENFLKALPKKHKYTFEFRDKSWLCDEVYELLKKYNAALCIYDYKAYQSPEILTADFVYIRLHGPEEEPYGGSYDGRTLAAYARKIVQWAEDGKDVYCYFDNDQKSCAPFDAQKLIESVEKKA